MASSTTARPSVRRLAATWLAAILAISALAAQPVGAAATVVTPVTADGCTTVELSSPANLRVAILVADCGDPTDTAFTVAVQLQRMAGATARPTTDPVIKSWGSPAPIVGTWINEPNLAVPQEGSYYLAIDAFGSQGGAPTTTSAVSVSGGKLVTVSVPLLKFRTGSMRPGAVPARVTWHATSPGTVAVRNFRYRYSNNGVWTAWTSTTAASFPLTVALGHTYAFEVYGRNLQLVAGPVQRATFHPKGYGESSSRISYAGTWRTGSNDHYWGGHTRFATAKGASLTFTFTGHEAALVMPVGPHRGNFNVYVKTDAGLLLQRTVQTWAYQNGYRKVMYTIRWPEAGTYTIVLRVNGTVGHPRVDLDGIMTID